MCVRGVVFNSTDGINLNCVSVAGFKLSIYETHVIFNIFLLILEQCIWTARDALKRA